MFHYVAPALTSGGQPVQFEYQVLPSISIHNNFSPSAPSIVHYLEERCKAVPFANAMDAGRQQLWNFIKGCLTARSSRYRINTGTYWSDGKPRRATARISLTGLHGNVMVISDFYSALGFIISETDSYQYHGRETATEKNNIHLKILAFYTKWITNVARSTYFGENGKDEAGPSTACIVFSPTQPFQTVAVPCAMFPNLSPAMKAEGRGIQQENLQNFIAGLGINGSSPRELQNEAVANRRLGVNTSVKTVGWRGTAAGPAGSYTGMRTIPRSVTATGSALAVAMATGGQRVVLAFRCRAGYQPDGAAQSAANELKLCMRLGAQIRHRWGLLLTQLASYRVLTSPSPFDWP
ncbi:hypothetical protein B0H14DRAFT_3137921 [Mycena olivaceomarginata]|nr:hypothetical protein B0H14DRAFT_3137921 [Mycena olivaceomarginata]